MKSSDKILLVAVALFALCFVASAQDTAKSVQWYCFEMENHNSIAATSLLTPEQLAKALGETGFIRLDRVRAFNGGAKWNISVAPFTDTLFVRSTAVRSFIPLTGPPKDLDSKDAR